MFFKLVIAALAIWRLANMLHWTDGPWGVFTHLRDMLGIYATVDYLGLRRLQIRGDSPLPMVAREMFVCMDCLSFWLGLPLAIVWFPDIWLVAVFAISAPTVLLERYVR